MPMKFWSTASTSRGANREWRRQKLVLESRPEHYKPYADNQECYGNCRWDLRGFLFVHGCFDRTEFRDFLSLMVVETGVDESDDTQDKEDDSDNDHEALHKLEPITTAVVQAKIEKRRTSARDRRGDVLF